MASLGVRGTAEQVVPPQGLGHWEVIMVRCEQSGELVRVYLDQFEDIFVEPGDRVWARLYKCPLATADLGTDQPGHFYYATQVRQQCGKLRRSSNVEGLKGVA